MFIIIVQLLNSDSSLHPRHRDNVTVGNSGALGNQFITGFIIFTITELVNRQYGQPSDTNNSQSTVTYWTIISLSGDGG